MFETESSISLRNDLLAEDYDAIDWPMSDDLDLIDPDYVCLDKGELLSYTVGAAVAAAVILQGRLVLEYPPSLLAAFTDGITKVDAVATFSVICLASFALNLFASASGLRRATIWDGLLSSYAALGIYLFPQVTIHWPFLVAIVVAGIALTVWECRDSRFSASLARLTWDVVVNVAFLSFLLVNLGGAGLIPMAASSPSLTENAQDGTSVLANLFNRTSLDDVSYQEIADMLQVVANIESDRLELNGHEPRVLVGYTGSAVSNYNVQTNAITLNASILSQPHGLSGYEAVECVAHEMAHAYENAVVNGTVKGRRNSPLGQLSPDDTARWREELDSGVDSSRHFVEYWCQDIEERARDYADSEMPYLLAVADGAACL